MNLSGGYSYTFINDKDVEHVAQYQNIHAFYAGVGYTFNDKVLVNSSYSQSDSMFVDTKTIKNISFGLLYKLNANWFTLWDYRYGLSDSTSKQEYSLRLGYYY
jgi:hypothetical protein